MIEEDQTVLWSCVYSWNLSLELGYSGWPSNSMNSWLTALLEPHTVGRDFAEEKNARDAEEQMPLNIFFLSLIKSHELWVQDYKYKKESQSL